VNSAIGLHEEVVLNR